MAPGLTKTTDDEAPFSLSALQAMAAEIMAEDPTIAASMEDGPPPEKKKGGKREKKERPERKERVKKKEDEKPLNIPLGPSGLGGGGGGGEAFVTRRFISHVHGPMQHRPI